MELEGEDLVSPAPEVPVIEENVTAIRASWRSRETRCSGIDASR
jgi:hypothetical protein